MVQGKGIITHKCGISYSCNVEIDLDLNDVVGNNYSVICYLEEESIKDIYNDELPFFPWDLSGIDNNGIDCSFA